MARRGQALVLPFWFHRESDGTYRIRIEQPWSGWIEASAEQAAAKWLEGKTVVKAIVVPGRLVNLVIR